MLNFKRIFLLFNLLLVGLVACSGEPEDVSYRILSPTPRSLRVVTGVPTVVAEDLTPFMSPTPPPPTATATEEPSSTPTEEVVEETPTNTPTGEVAEVDVTAPASTPTDAAPTEEVATGPSGPTPTSNNDELRARQEDRNFLVQLRIDQECYETNAEIPAGVIVRNFSDQAFYLYLRGQILFSINNSPLAPDFPAPEPSLREDFILLEVDQTYEWNLEDIGLFIQGMGSQSGIDFGDTFLGLPPGNYWLTAAYSNTRNGLTEQRDGTYLIPQAAWRGIAVSREVRFQVVNDLSECPEA